MVVQFEVPEDSLEQWDLAARLLEFHGEAGIAEFVEDMMRATVELDNGVQSARWRVMIDKLAPLMTVRDGIAH